MWDAGFPCFPCMLSAGMWWSLSIQAVFSVKSRLIIPVERPELLFFSRNLRETTLDPGHGDLWILDFPYFPVSLFCPGFKSDHALLAQGKGQHLKYQQELTIPACLQVLEKQQMSVPLISQRWCFYKTMCNKTMCMTEGINGWHFELVDIWRYSFTSSNSVLTFLNCARGQKVGKCQV